MRRPPRTRWCWFRWPFSRTGRGACCTSTRKLGKSRPGRSKLKHAATRELRLLIARATVPAESASCRSWSLEQTTALLHRSRWGHNPPASSAGRWATCSGSSPSEEMMRGTRGAQLDRPYAEFRIMPRKVTAAADGRYWERYDLGIIRRTDLDVNVSNFDFQLDRPCPGAVADSSNGRQYGPGHLGN